MIGLLILAAAAKPLAVTVTGPPCEFTVEGAVVQQDQFEVAVKRARRTYNSVVIHLGTPDAPWRCVGGAMTYLARAKFKNVSFDPPLSETR